MSNRQFQFNKGKVTERKLRDEHVLIPISSSVGNMNSLFHLNETAALIFEKAKEGTGEAAICEAVVQEFEVTPDQAAKDVDDLLNQLLEIGALLECETSS